MRHKFYTKHNKEFSLSLAESLIQFLPLLLRTYYELRNRAGQGKSKAKIAPDELVSSLGYDVDFVQGILKDLSMVGMIKYTPTRKAHEKWTITILVM